MGVCRCLSLRREGAPRSLGAGLPWDQAQAGPARGAPLCSARRWGGEGPRAEPHLLEHLPCLGAETRAAPLSDVKKTKVFPAIFRSRRRPTIRPTLSSISRTASPYLRESQHGRQGPGVSATGQRLDPNCREHSRPPDPPTQESRSLRPGTHRPRWLVPKKAREAYTGAWVASMAQ